MMKKVLVPLTIAVAIIFLFIPIFPVFSFTETRVEDPEMYYTTLHKETSFQFVFTHSIHLTDVVEAYEVLAAYKIRPVSMSYSDVAIGMPGYAEEGQTLIYEDGTYTLYYEETSLPDFSIYIGDVDYSLKFLYQEKAYDLKKNLLRGKSYLFEIKKVSLYEKLKGVELHGG
ncbi:MAG: DUF1850 domain-containing protein [Lysinibacillus sp.]